MTTTEMIAIRKDCTTKGISAWASVQKSPTGNGYVVFIRNNNSPLSSGWTDEMTQSKAQLLADVFNYLGE